MTLAASLIGGPVGTAAGGAVGACLGAWMTSGQFKPLPQIIMELPPNQQQILSNAVHDFIQRLDWTDVAQLTSLVMGNADLKRMVVAEMKAFFLKQLNAEVCHID
ncbi:protein C19orf12 homolog [Mustelus asterias]